MYLAELCKPLLTSSKSLLIAFSDLSTISCKTIISKCRIIFTIALTALSFDIFATPKLWMLKAPKMIGGSMTCWFSVLKYENINNCLVEMLLYTCYTMSHYLMLICPPICRQTRLSSRQNSGGWCVWFFELILVVTLRLRITGTVATTHIEIEICGVISLNCTTKQYCYFQKTMCITPTIHFATSIV